MDELSLPKQEASKDAILEVCREHGVCVIDSFLDDEVVSALRKDFERFYTHPQYEVTKHGVDDHTQTLNVDFGDLPAPDFPALTDLVSTSLFEETVRSYYEEDDVLYPSNIWLARSRGTPHSPSGEPSEGPPYAYHIDQRNKFKFFFYLTEVGEGDGATQFIPEYHKEYKRHRREWLEKNDRPETEFDNLIWHYHVAQTAEEKEVPVHAPAGSLLIFDTDVPHRAGPLEEGHEREILRIDTYSPTHSGTNRELPQGSSENLIVKGIKNPGSAAKHVLGRLSP